MLSKEMQQWIQLCRQSKQASSADAEPSRETVIQIRQMLDQMSAGWPLPEIIQIEEKTINGIQGEVYHYQ